MDRRFAETRQEFLFFPSIFNTHAQTYAFSVRVIIIIYHGNHIIIFRQTSQLLWLFIIGFSENILHYFNEIPYIFCFYSSNKCLNNDILVETMVIMVHFCKGYM